MQTGAVYRIHSQGALQVTENSLDVAIRGEGFFQVNLPSGDTAYTRDGTFQLNENGEIVTMQATQSAPALPCLPMRPALTLTTKARFLLACPVKHPQ